MIHNYAGINVLQYTRLSLIRRSLSVIRLWGSPIHRTPHVVIPLTILRDHQYILTPNQIYGTDTYLCCDSLVRISDDEHHLTTGRFGSSSRVIQSQNPLRWPLATSHTAIHCFFANQSGPNSFHYSLPPTKCVCTSHPSKTISCPTHHTQPNRSQIA